MSQDPLLRSIAEHTTYPINLVKPNLRRQALVSLAARLRSLSKKLFLQQGPAAVQVLQVRQDTRDVEEEVFEDFEEWKDHLSSRSQLVCHMTFIGAKDARSRLKISQEMFSLLMSHHQAMPIFLEFVFPFGLQQQRRDPHIGGFCCNTTLQRPKADQQSSIDRLGGQLEFCYTLQAPEPKTDSPDPWSVRQTSVWHCFDLASGQQRWVVIKANDIIRDALAERAGRQTEEPDNNLDDKDKALLLALGSHLEICYWSVENWHWYLTSMEEDVRHKTKRAVSGNLRELDTSSVLVSEPLTTSPASQHLGSPVNEQQPQQTPRGWFSFGQRHVGERTAAIAEKAPSSTPAVQSLDDNSSFSFTSLQDALGQEELANSAIVVLRSNAETLRRLGLEYARMCEADKEGCCWLERETIQHIQTFRQKLDELGSTVLILQARASTYLQLVQHRKSLLYAILQAETNKHTYLVSAEAKNSSVRMEKMTDFMHTIATRTHTETIRMRIMTAIFLVFLPGTFCSTLMSTPVIKFPEDGDTAITDAMIGNGALQVYVVLSVPLIFVTFLSWYLMHRRERRAPHVEDGIVH